MRSPLLDHIVRCATVLPLAFSLRTTLPNPYLVLYYYGFVLSFSGFKLADEKAKTTSGCILLEAKVLVLSFLANYNYSSTGSNTICQHWQFQPAPCSGLDFSLPFESFNRYILEPCSRSG